MKINRTKLFAILLFALPLLILTAFRVTPVKVAASNDDDAATMFTKFSCFACHTKTAAKNFDPAKPDAELVQAILKGKEKNEKRPVAMKAFETVGVTEAQAQALVDYMRSLRKPAG